MDAKLKTRLPVRPGTPDRAGWSLLPMGPLPAWLLVAIVAALTVIDAATGPYFQFPSAYIVFVVVVAWSNGARLGVALAVALPLTRVALMHFYWLQPWDPIAYVGTALTRIAVWSLLALVAARLADHERTARAEVQALIALLPVCAGCHKIRDQDDQWQSLKEVAARQSDHFSEGLCPACLRARLPEHVAPDLD